MMKQKWYLLIISLMSCVTVWAQEDKPLWSIIDLKLTTVTDGDNKVVFKDGIYNLPNDAKEVKATISFRLRQNQPTEEEKPGKIWYHWSNNASIESFEPNYIPVEDVDTLWSVSKEIDLSMPTEGADITLSLGLSEDKIEYTADGQVRVWALPGAPSLSPQSYTTFTDESYSFKLNEYNSIPDVFLPKYYVNGTDITEGKVYEGKTSKDIGDRSYETTALDLGYSYSFGDKVWVDKTVRNAIFHAATLTTYHRPVYKLSIIVNNQEPVNGRETTVTHSDDVELIVSHDYGYGGDSDFTSIWSGKGQSYTANNIGEVETGELSTVKINNKLSNDVEDSQEFKFNVKVLPVIKIEKTIGNESYSFIPEGDTKISVKKIHNQTDLNWMCVWSLDGNELGESDDALDKNEITLSADQLKEAKEYELVAKVSCYNKNNEGKKYLDDKTIAYKINVVSNPKVTSYGDFDDQDNIITCHNQKFKVTIETEGGYTGDNAFRFALESDGGNYGHSKQTEGTEYDITYENTGNGVVESLFSFSGVNIIPKDKSTTGVEQSRKVEGTSETFHATIYPYPQVQFKDQLVNYFYGSTISKSLENKYALPTAGNTWEFEWLLDGVTQSSFDNSNNYSSTIEDGGDKEFVEHTLVVKANNYYNNKSWGSQELSFNFIAWHRANLDGIRLSHENSNNNNIYEGHTFNLSALTQYGYPEGWTYTWKRDDISDVLSAKGTDDFVAKFYGNEGSEIQSYNLHVENSIPGLNETPFKDDKSINLTIWRKAENYTAGSEASIISITDAENGATIDNRIREGRELRLQVPQAQFGYNNDWTYTWNGTETKSSQISLPIDNVQANGEKMNSESRTLSLIITNMGPNGNPWEETTMSKTYTVYRKPKTPTSLVPKGNGASRTLIATIDISDDQLKDNDYYLCFGHRETSGAVTLIGEPQLQEGPGQTRFSNQIPQEQWDDKGNLCVFSVWHYADGTWITSGLRFISDVKEDWDGSDYTGKNTYSGTTRGGDTTGIQETEIPSQYIQTTYDLRGTSRSKMQRGLNIVRMTDGTVRKVIKK